MQFSSFLSIYMYNLIKKKYKGLKRSSIAMYDPWNMEKLTLQVNIHTNPSPTTDIKLVYEI